MIRSAVYPMKVSYRQSLTHKEQHAQIVTAPLRDQATYDGHGGEYNDRFRSWSCDGSWSSSVNEY